MMISVQFPSLLFAVISSKPNNNFRCLLWARLIHTRIQFVRYEFSMTTSSLIRKFPFVLLMPDDNVKTPPPPNPPIQQRRFCLWLLCNNNLNNIQVWNLTESVKKAQIKNMSAIKGRHTKKWSDCFKRGGGGKPPKVLSKIHFFLPMKKATKV